MYRNTLQSQYFVTLSAVPVGGVGFRGMRAVASTYHLAFRRGLHVLRLKGDDFYFVATQYLRLRHFAEFVLRRQCVGRFQLIERRGLKLLSPLLTLGASRIA